MGQQQPAGFVPDGFVPDPPHPEARMSAAAPGSTAGGPVFPGDPDAVTLGDLMDNPTEAIAKIGQAIKRDVSDPKMWLGVAASYFGPKLFGLAAPVVAKAAASVQRGMQAVEPGDIVGMIPRPRSVDNAINVARKVGGAMREPAAAPVASAPAPVAPPTPPVAQSSPGPVTGAAPPSPVRMGPDGLLVGRPGGNPDLPDQRALNDAAIAVRRAAYQQRMAADVPPPPPAPAAATVKLSAAETRAFLDLMQRGLSGPDAMKSVLQQRELMNGFGLKPPTADQTRFPKGMRGAASGARKNP